VGRAAWRSHAGRWHDSCQCHLGWLQPRPAAGGPPGHVPPGPGQDLLQCRIMAQLGLWITGHRVEKSETYVA
jgi:hypothetical protein